MTVTDDEVGTTDDMRRTLRDVRRVARLLMQGLEPDDGAARTCSRSSRSTSASSRTRSP